MSPIQTVYGLLVARYAAACRASDDNRQDEVLAIMAFFETEWPTEVAAWKTATGVA